MYKKVFTGKDKYTVGIVFLFGTLAGFYLNMRKIGVADFESTALLATLAIVARFVV